MMRRYARILLLAIVAILMVPALAQAAATTVTVDGKTVKWPVAPVKAGNVMLVDAKTVLPLLGASYSYDKKKKRLTAKGGGHTLILTAGSKTAQIDGDDLPITAAPAATKSGLNIPADIAAEAFEGSFQWVSASKYDIISKKKWTALVKDQVLPIVRKLIDAQQNEDVETILSFLNMAEYNVQEWFNGETSWYEDYDRKLKLASVEVTTIGIDYAIVQGVVSDTLVDGPYELDKDMSMEYVLEKSKNGWKISYITTLHTNYWIPDEPAGADKFRKQVDEFVTGMTKALNTEDAAGYAAWADQSIATDEQSRIEAFFDEQDQQTAVYDASIVHLDDNGAVYVVVYETVTSKTSGEKEYWDSQTFYKLIPQSDGKLRVAEGYNLVFEQK